METLRIEPQKGTRKDGPQKSTKGTKNIKNDFVLFVPFCG
jgi:hypothetical protein